MDLHLFPQHFQFNSSPIYLRDSLESGSLLPRSAPGTNYSPVFSGGCWRRRCSKLPSAPQSMYPVIGPIRHGDRSGRVNVAAPGAWRTAWWGGEEGQQEPETHLVAPTASSRWPPDARSLSEPCHGELSILSRWRREHASFSGKDFSKWKHKRANSSTRVWNKVNVWETSQGLHLFCFSFVRNEYQDGWIV